MATEHPTLPAFLTSATRLPCRIFLSWSIAGGLVSGGFLVAATTLAGEEVGSAAAQIAVLLWALGAGAGFAHGALLGYLARDVDRPSAHVIRDMRRMILWIVPALFVSVILAVWISLTGPVLRGVRPGVFQAVGIFGTWLVGLTLLGWAAVEGYEGLRILFRRYPELRAASVVGSVAFAVLATLFVIEPPRLWFTELRVTGPGAVVLAFGAAVWIALPVAVAVLVLIRRWRHA